LPFFLLRLMLLFCERNKIPCFVFFSACWNICFNCRNSIVTQEVGLARDTIKTFYSTMKKALLLKWRVTFEPSKDTPITLFTVMCFVTIGSVYVS
jgi:hypothetical protein